MERIGRSALTANQIPDNLLVISCEEDYEICVPLLEKGIKSNLICQLEYYKNRKIDFCDIVLSLQELQFTAQSWY